MQHQIKVVKVGRNKADSKGLLWDKIYLVKETDKHLIPRLFNFSLVIPKNQELEDNLNKALNSEKTYTEQKISRTDNTSQPMSNITAQNPKELVVIPILGSFDKKSKSFRPRYLSTAKHHQEVAANEEKGVGNPDDFPIDAYIQTPECQMKPICAACPNSMIQLTGGCRLGGKSCYESLIFGKHSKFKEMEKKGSVVVDEDFTNMQGEE